MRQKVYYLLSGLVGLLIGWLALGWWLWPVAYVGDAYSYELSQADRLRYAQGAVDNFTLTGQVDPDWFGGWTAEEVSQALAQVAAQPNRQTAAYSLGVKLGIAVQAKVVQDPTPVPLTVKLAKVSENRTSETDSTWLMWLAISTPIIGCVAVSVGFFLMRRNRTVGAATVALGFDRAFISRKTEEYIPVKPILTHILTHAQLIFGPDQPTDQHFPIEREGTSLGEFGVNQVDDQPAWDVWLFDQRAIVTVTKVLADQGSEELASRGEVVKWYDPVILETPNLKMVGQVKNAFVNEMHQSNGAFSIEITVEAKDEN